MGKKTTIKDIAERCGVSLMAVSRALNHKGGISQKTAQRILDVAAELRYSPNLIAKSLRVNESRTLGVVVSDSSAILIDPVLKGINDAAKAADYSIVLTNTNRIRENELEAVRVLCDKRIDGLVMAAPLQTDEAFWQEVRNFDVPFVSIMRSGIPDMDSVVTNNFDAARALIDYLITTGTDRIVHISMPRDHQTGRERLRGYRQALRDHGLKADAKDIVFMAPTVDQGKKGMERFLRQGFRKGAVFCASDMLAIGAMHVILSAGLRIPDDIRLCGYDGMDLLDYLKVPLTTMRQPVYEMGMAGVQLLIQRLKHPNKEFENLVIPSVLEIRQST